jgi:ABC-2 type transport system permease protein
MQVFKAYFKIVKKNLPMLIMYLVIFLSVVIGITASNQTQEMVSFTARKSDLALINEDEDSALTRGLVTYIQQNANLVDVEHDEEALKDALFYEKIDYILKIPEGFSQGFMDGEAVQLEQTKGIDQMAGIQLEMLLNRFLNTASLYAKYGNNLTQAEVIEKTMNDLSLETPVEMKTFDSGLSNADLIAYFFNYASYSTIIILIFGISTFMLVFNKSFIKQRTMCSPLSNKQIVFQRLSGDLVLALGLWLITTICGFLVHGESLLSANGALWILNLLIFSLVCLSVSFFIGSLIKSKNALSAVANTISLGSSFLCGAFVPQYLLGESVLTVARFIPTYWYIRANNLIAELNTFNSETLGPVLITFAIQIGFLVAIIAVSLVINKQRRVQAFA